MNGKKSTLPYDILAFIIVAIWGATFISTKQLILNGLQPAQIFLIRFILAYAGICMISHDRLFSESLKDEVKFILLGISGGSLYFLTENTAVEFTQASNVSFLVCTTPLVTALMMAAVRRLAPGLLNRNDRITFNLAFISGTILALTGMAMIVFNGKYVLKLSPKGDLLALAASVSWAVYSILLSGIADRYGTAFISRKVFFYGLITIIPVIMVQHGFCMDLSVFARPIVWGNLLFLGVVASLGCYVLWNKVMKVLGTVKASNYIYLNPLFTLVAAIIVLDERITVLAGIGCALIFIGVLLAGKSGSTEA